MKKNNTYHRWTAADVAFLIARYQEYSSTELAEKLNVTLGSVKKKSRELKLIKTKDALRALYSRPNAGQFAKGNDPRNTKHDNCITLRVDKSGRMYKWIRIAKAKWEMLHVNLWKKAGNDIPAGYVVRFKDGNSLNCFLQNLELVHRSTNLQKNRQEYLQNHGPKYKVRSEKVKRKEAKVKVAKLKKQRQVIEKKKDVRIRASQPVLPKRQVKVFAIREIDISQCVAVKINNKTIVYVKPGTDIEKIKKQFNATL